MLHSHTIAIIIVTTSKILKCKSHFRLVSASEIT